MAFSIRPDFWIADFADFAGAEAKYHNTKPIRGNPDDIRPLGSRSAQHMRIVKHNENSYSCRLYNTDVATFYRDGTIEYETGGWNTTSTANFMDACMPKGWGASKFNNCIQAFHSPTGNYYVVQNGFTIDTNTGDVSGARTPTKEVVNREESKQKREAYKPFLVFAKTFMEVLNMQVPLDRETYYECHRKASKFLYDASLVSEEHWLEVLSVLAYTSYWDNTAVSFNQVKAKIYKANTVYDTINLPIGTMQK